MGFRRVLLPALAPEPGRLTADMVGIGMLFAATGSVEPNIEDTLLFASIAGMDGEDLRVLSVLCTWLDVHSRWVNADRLVAIASSAESSRVRAFWAGFARWKGADRRFRRLAALAPRERVDLLAAGQAFQLRRFGEDPRFAEGPLRVDGRALRERPGDVLSPAELAARHATYRWRIIIGPTYRADLWATLESAPDISVTELARRAYSSIGAAWEARRDHKLLRDSSARQSGSAAMSSTPRVSL